LATTSCDVQAAGLSTTIKPCVVMNGRSARNRKLALDSPYDLVDAVVGGEAGREPVAATTFGFGDAAHVDFAEGSEAHPDGAVGLLLDDARDLGFGGAAQDVDEALDLLDRDLMLGEVVLGDRGPHEPSLGNEVGVAQRVAEQLEVREAVLLEQRAAQTRHG